MQRLRRVQVRPRQLIEAHRRMMRELDQRAADASKVLRPDAAMWHQWIARAA